MKASVLAPIVALGVAFASSASAQENLVQNGSFEQGTYAQHTNGQWADVPPATVTGWTSTGLANWHNGAAFQPIPEGNLVMDLENGGFCFGGQRATLSQTITTVPGKSYDFVFLAAKPIDGSACSGQSVHNVRASVNGVPHDFAVSPSWHMALSWELKQVTFTATSSSTTLEFSSPDGDTNGYWGVILDDVTVVMAESSRDDDNDGVANSADLCAASVGTLVNAEGCAIAQLCPCSGPATGGSWRNHGAYVSCTARTAGAFVEAELLTPEQVGPIVSTAARNTCGK